jgi:hypothetical protein
MPKTKPKASPGLGTDALPHSQETTTQRHSRRGDLFPSLTVATAGETVAQTVAKAAKDSAFAQNPNDSTIGYSSNLDNDEELDNDDDSEYDSMTSNSIGDDAEEESSTEDVADPHNYSKLVDSKLLEDDEPTVLIVLIGLRERVLVESPYWVGPLNPTQHLCRQLRQKMP